eukprot:6205404-Pleurochrysis_carterae.AAC.2
MKGRTSCKDGGRRAKKLRKASRHNLNARGKGGANWRAHTAGAHGGRVPKRYNESRTGVGRNGRARRTRVAR